MQLSRLAIAISIAVGALSIGMCVGLSFELLSAVFITIMSVGLSALTGYLLSTWLAFLSVHINVLKAAVQQSTK